MQTVPHTPASVPFHRTVADVFGERDTTTPTASPVLDWPQAVAQVEAALCTNLRLEAPPESMRKALDLVLARAVTLHGDGTASVQSGQQTYTLAPTCPCPSATRYPELCKHTIAVELHRRALKLCTATPALTELAPSASIAENPASPPDALANAPATPASPPPTTVPGTAAWRVQEAPTSACFKWRIGDAELMYTFRGVTDDEVLARIQTYLPQLQAIIATCTANTTARPASPPPATPPQAPPPAHAATNGQATSSRNGSAARPATGRDQATGWCSLHNVAMDQHVNARGTWWSHDLGNRRYCKGAK